MLSTHSRETTNITSTHAGASCCWRLLLNLNDWIHWNNVIFHNLWCQIFTPMFLFLLRFQLHCFSSSSSIYIYCILYDCIKILSIFPLKLPNIFTWKWYIKNINKCIYYALVFTHQSLHTHTRTYIAHLSSTTADNYNVIQCILMRSLRPIGFM